MTEQVAVKGISSISEFPEYERIVRPLYEATKILFEGLGGEYREAVKRYDEWFRYTPDTSMIVYSPSAPYGHALTPRHKSFGDAYDSELKSRSQISKTKGNLLMKKILSAMEKILSEIPDGEIKDATLTLDMDDFHSLESIFVPSTSRFFLFNLRKKLELEVLAYSKSGLKTLAKIIEK